jgi:lipopolysaccharide/colanic/teichoic acid biosynthesis glycosyltransferase
MYPVLKRCADFVLSILIIILLSPVFVLMSLWIKMTSKGPVMYRGIRVGKDGKAFQILKFRTMVVNAENMGASSTAEDDPRITKVGRFLRRFKLDELPQLINVLRGEMSFVGPRPQVQWAVNLYSEEEWALLKVRPGITDYASIKYRNEGEILKGSADPDRDYLEKIAPGKLRLGLYYVNTYSLITDVKIIFATALILLGGNPDWCLPKEETLTMALPKPNPSDVEKASIS